MPSTLTSTELLVCVCVHTLAVCLGILLPAGLEPAGSHVGPQILMCVFTAGGCRAALSLNTDKTTPVCCMYSLLTQAVL